MPAALNLKRKTAPASTVPKNMKKTQHASPRRPEKQRSLVLSEEKAALSVFEELIPKVLTALKSKEYGLDRKLSAVLQRIAPHALKEDLMTRHPFHDAAVSELEDFFDATEKQMKAKLEEAVDAAEIVSAERKIADDSLKAATAKLQEAEAGLEAAKDVVVTAEKDVNEAHTRQEAAEKQREQSKKSEEDATRAAEKVLSLTSSFRAVMASGDPEAEGDIAENNVETLLEEFAKLKDVPDSLATAAPTALKRAPEAREPFDLTVLQTMEEALGTAHSRAEGEIHSAKEAVDADEARVSELQELFKTACDVLAEANLTKNSAQDAVEAAEKERDEAEKALENFGDRVRTAQKQYRQVEAKVETFYSELSSFRYLQARCPEFEPPRSWSPARPSRRPDLLDEETREREAEEEGGPEPEPEEKKLQKKRGRGPHKKHEEEIPKRKCAKKSSMEDLEKDERDH